MRLLGGSHRDGGSNADARAVRPAEGTEAAVVHRLLDAPRGPLFATPGALPWRGHRRRIESQHRDSGASSTCPGIWPGGRAEGANAGAQAVAPEGGVPDGACVTLAEALWDEPWC